MDERVFEPLFDRLLAPFGVLFAGLALLAAIILGQVNQPLGGVLAPVENDILDRLAQLGSISS